MTTPNPSEPTATAPPPPPSLPSPQPSPQPSPLPSPQPVAQQELPPPAAPSATRTRKPRRPQIAIVAAIAIVYRGMREFLGRSFGTWGVVAGIGLFLAILIGWRLIVRSKARRAGVAEYTPAAIAKQLERSGVAPSAFEEDGTLLGASVLAVNQRSKVIEVVSEYEIFSSTGAKLGHVHQIGQGRFKRAFRFIGSFDQFFTHHFDITDASDQVVLRITRPAKLFKSRVEVFDGSDHFIGRIVQRNVFGKIDFGMYAPSGDMVGQLRAENWRAWDFRIELPSGIEVARITKTWEGVARTMLSTADTYVVRVHQRLGDPMRALTFAAALTVDLALKQDARGLGA